MKLSIIILSFNSYDDTTGKCLAALAADPDFGEWEVIVVDNASDAYTQSKLAEARYQYPSVKFVLNAQNVGFAAGNNVGINLASGNVIVLLNSDAFPSPGMLKRLTEHLSRDERLGMVGPVTNAAGNEQCIFTKSSDMKGKIDEGLLYALPSDSDTMLAYRLDFFCVAIPKRVFTQVGLLDESFGRGYYEDFDFSLKVKAAGFKLGVAEDTFVYHRGSTCFGKAARDVKELLKRNKKLILAKHGHTVLFQHKRSGNLSLLSQYLTRKKLGEDVSEYRISNRISLAKAEIPKSFFKRWRYLRSVNRIVSQF